jgi:hypothetical protein
MYFHQYNGRARMHVVVIDKSSLFASSTDTIGHISGFVVNAETVSVNIYASSPLKPNGMNWFGNQSIPVINGRWTLLLPKDILVSMSQFSPLTVQVKAVSISGVATTTTGIFTISK